MSEFDVTSCFGGDPAAWRAFVERYTGVIHAAVRRTLGQASQDQIEDLIQDVFIRLVKDDYRALRSFDASRGASLTTWLTVVARSVAIDEMRRRRVSPVSLEAVDSEPGTAGAASSVRHEVNIPMEVLTERQRLVLSMLFDQEMTVPQAAQLLNVDDQTIRSTKHKALSRLRKALDDQQSSDPSLGQKTAGNLLRDGESAPSSQSRPDKSIGRATDIFGSREGIQDP